VHDASATKTALKQHRKHEMIATSTAARVHENSTRTWCNKKNIYIE